MAEALVQIGPDWTLVNSTDAATIQFQNRGAGSVEVSRGTTSAPVGNVPAYEFAAGYGLSGDIDTLFPGGTGARLWARSLNGSRIVAGWA